MRCTNCGCEIPDGQLYCKRCGKEIRIVPDYNPLDDVLAAQVKGGIDGGERPLDDYDYEKSYTSDLRRGEGQRAEERGDKDPEKYIRRGRKILPRAGDRTYIPRAGDRTSFPQHRERRKAGRHLPHDGDGGS